MIRTEYGNGVVNRLYPQDESNRYHAPNLKYDLEDENLNITILGKQIGCKSKVLDVACGEGKFGQLYSQKQVQAWGIDLDPVSVDYAQKAGIFRQVICCDIEKEFEKVLQLKNEIGSNFDYIVLCDVLEHFVNPSRVLENLYQVLRENGKILVSIPNAANADIFLNLLEGRFNYAQSGILDNTHFHFFTKTSFAQWIDEINMKSKNFAMDCKYLGGTYGVTEYLEKVESQYPLVYQLIQHNPQYQTIQLLFELTKIPKEEFKDISLLCNENNEILNRIEECLSEKYSEGINISIEANERNSLKEEICVLRQGWQECNNKLIETEERLQESQKGWQECNNKLIETEERLQESQKGWQECNNKLIETEERLQESQKGWQECNNKLIETEERLQESQKGWQECNNKLIETDENLQEALAGWKKCDEELNIKIEEVEVVKADLERCLQELTLKNQ